MIEINSLIDQVLGVVKNINEAKYATNRAIDLKREGGTALDERLSGAHWSEIADEKWPNSSDIEALDEGSTADNIPNFKQNVKNFIDMLKTNNIKVYPISTRRPKERAYLFHYCVEIKKGRITPDKVESMNGVDIIWDHGDLNKSKAAAKDMAEAFGLVGPAALDSLHIQGKATDLKMDFSGNSQNGINTLGYMNNNECIARTIMIDKNEATFGESAKGKKINNIRSRELSIAGQDFGVIRAIDNDVVHWSINGE